MNRGRISRLVLIGFLALVPRGLPLETNNSGLVCDRSPSAIGSCRSIFVSRVLQAKELRELQKFVAADRAVAASTEHATSIRIHRDSLGNPIRTEKVALIVHGLHRSPKSMKDQSDLAFNLGYNVINLRLPGHFEKERSALDRAQGEDWLEKVSEAYDLALVLGNRITLIGHSTGGLLTAFLTIQKRDEKAITDIVWFAPALRVAPSKRSQAYWLSLVGLSGWAREFWRTPHVDSKYLSTWAGWQVVLLSEKMHDLTVGVDNRDSEPYTALLDALAGKSLTVFDTAIDNTIDRATNAALVERFKARGGLVNYIVVDSNSKLGHAHMTTGTGNPIYQSIIEPVLRKAMDGRN